MTAVALGLSLAAGCRNANKPTPAAPAISASAAVPRAPSPAAKLAPTDGGTFVTVVKPQAVVDAGAPVAPTVLTLEIPALAKEKAPPATFAVRPVRQVPLKRLPTTFDAEGKLLADCSDKTCGLWDRATGSYRGELPKGDLAAFRTSSESMSNASTNGKYVLKAWGDKGGVAIVRVEGGAVVARAERAGQSCATVGAWKGDELRVAIPCGTRMVALDGAPARATWSGIMPGGGTVETEGVWSDKVYGSSRGPTDPEEHQESSYEGSHPLTWGVGEDGGEVTPHHPSVDAVSRSFDPVRGCVFDSYEVCGCDCNESLTVQGCDDDHGAGAFWHTSPSRGVEGDDGRLVISGDGLTYGWLVEQASHRGYITSRFEATRIGKRADTFTVDSIGAYGGADVVILPSKGAFAIVGRDGGDKVLISIHRFGKPVMTVELDQADYGFDSQVTLHASANDGRILVGGVRGAVVFDTDDESVDANWTSPKVSDASDASKRAEFLGFLRDPAKPKSVALTLDGIPHELDIETDALTPRGPIDPSELVMPATKPQSPKYRVTGLRGLERTSDGARMIVNDDRVYPQGADALEAWHDLDESTHFLVGGDVLRSPLVTRDQIDPLLIVKGSFAKFLKGEPLPASRVAQLPYPPYLRVTRVGGNPRLVSVRVDDAGSPITAFEIDHAGRVERIAATAAGATVVQTIPPETATRVRACGAICSSWVNL